MLGRVQAGGIGEGAAGEADLLGPLGHLAGELFLGAGDRLGHGHAGVVARLDDDAADQVLDLHPLADLDEHLRAAHLPGPLADQDLLVELELRRP